jgi:chitodextrinase
VTYQTSILLSIPSIDDCEATGSTILAIAQHGLGDSAIQVSGSWKAGGFCTSSSANSGGSRLLRRHLQGGSDTYEVQTTASETTDAETVNEYYNSNEFQQSVNEQSSSSVQQVSSSNMNYFTAELVLERSKSQAIAFGEHDLTGANVQNVQALLPQEKFDELFPVRNNKYQYDHFISAVAYFPDFCADLEKCKEELSTIFAHFVQETGKWDDSDTENLPFYKQGLFATCEYGCCEEPKQDKCNDYNLVDPTNPFAKFYPVVDEQMYYGRGAKQLSWNYNYGLVSLAFTGDRMTFLDDPDLVLEPQYIMSTAMWFYMTPQNPKPSMHDLVCGYWEPNAHDLEVQRFVNTPAQRFARTVEIINGEQECFSDPLIKPDAAKKRFDMFMEFAREFDVTDRPESDADYVFCGDAVSMVEDVDDSVPPKSLVAGADFKLNYEIVNWNDQCGCYLANFQTPYYRSLDMLDECELSHPTPSCAACGKSEDVLVNEDKDTNGWLMEPDCSTEPRQVCEHSFTVNDIEYTVFSPREPHFMMNGFCNEHGLQVAVIQSADLYNQIYTHLEVWTYADSPSCDPEESRNGYNTMYAGPEPYGACHLLNQGNTFPNTIEDCGPQTDRRDWGLLCQPFIEMDECEHTFWSHELENWYTVYSPREEVTDGNEFCRSRGKSFADIADSTTYNQLKSKIRAWTSTEDPTCETDGTAGGSTLYRNPNLPNKCYVMSSDHSWAMAEITCSHQSRDYGVLCVHPPRSMCEHSFYVRDNWYTVFSPNQDNINEKNFCRSQGMELAEVHDESLYNDIRPNLQVWLTQDSPTCEGDERESPRREGWYTLYSGPHSPEACYIMTTSYDFPHAIPCSWREASADYGVLCKRIMPVDVCEHEFEAEGKTYTVYSPRLEYVDGHAFCSSRNKRWAQVNDAATYDSLKVKIHAFAGRDSPTCESEGRRGWYTLYSGPNSPTQCYTMTTSYEFPHSIPCHWHHEDYGVLCEH